MAARGVQGLIAVTALMGLAACGSVSAGRAGHPASASASSSKAPAAAAGTPAGASLCSDGRSADRVVVSRAASARAVTLRGTTQVQAVAAALCALPPVPAGQHCAAASAESVRLVFAAGQRSFPAVTVQESGCRSVTGMGPTRSWSGSSRFGALLDEAVGGLGRLVPGTHPSSVPLGS
ncbi:MAG TPA: hypothetical protein VH089_06040 [Streptosporangiaceae bacterium]|nr:hypothetical protein [Streptosporangiaceae bacterium]